MERDHNGEIVVRGRTIYRGTMHRAYEYRCEGHDEPVVQAAFWDEGDPLPPAERPCPACGKPMARQGGRYI